MYTSEDVDQMLDCSLADSRRREDDREGPPALSAADVARREAEEAGHQTHEGSPTARSSLRGHEIVMIERNMRLALNHARRIIANPVQLDEVPEGKSLVLIPYDDRELAYLNRALGQRLQRNGENVACLSTMAGSDREASRSLSSAFFKQIEQHALGASLVGIGLGWLFISARNRNSRQAPYRRRDHDLLYSHDAVYDRGYDGAVQRHTSDNTDWAAGRGLQHDLHVTQSAVSSATDRAQSAAGNTVGQAQDKASQVADQVQSTASQWGYQAQFQTQRAASGFQQMLEERPLAVAAGAVAVGLAVGLAIPPTPQEHRLMGLARDTLMDRAQDTVQQTAQKVQSAAQEAVGAAEEALQEHL